jgi:quercetin dioxygenase-like cupin family protein
MSVATAIRAGEGEARWWFAALAEIKASAADTDGQLTIVEVTEPPGAQAPLHVHHREDEALYVLDGELHCRLGDQELTAGLGQLVFGPRELAHTFKAGPSGARALVLLTPAGFKQMFQEGGIPAHTPPRHRPGLRRPTGDPAVGQVRHGRHRPAAHLTASGQLSDRSEKHVLVLRRHWYWRDYGRHR